MGFTLNHKQLTDHKHPLDQRVPALGWLSACNTVCCDREKPIRARGFAGITGRRVWPPAWASPLHRGLRYAALAWIRYGRAKRGIDSDESDLLLDRFMPDYEVAERHSIGVACPAEITFQAAATLDQPGYVKIIWTSRSDAISATESIARTDTRVTTTDPGARAKFRLYWAFLSPGILLIRKVALAMIKKKAERLASRALPTASLI